METQQKNNRLRPSRKLIPFHPPTDQKKKKKKSGSLITSAKSKLNTSQKYIL